MSRRRRRSFDFRRYCTPLVWIDVSDPQARTLSGSSITSLKDKSGNIADFSTVAGSPIITTRNGKDVLTGGRLASSQGISGLNSSVDCYTWQAIQYSASSNPGTIISSFGNLGSVSNWGANFIYEDRSPNNNIAYVNFQNANTGTLPIYTIDTAPDNSLLPNVFQSVRWRTRPTGAASTRAYVKTNGSAEINLSNPSTNTLSGSPGVAYFGNSGGDLFIGEVLSSASIGGNYSVSFIDGLFRQKWGTY